MLTPARALGHVQHSPVPVTKGCGWVGWGTAVGTLQRAVQRTCRRVSFTPNITAMCHKSSSGHERGFAEYVLAACWSLELKAVLMTGKAAQAMKNSSHARHQAAKGSLGAQTPRQFVTVCGRVLVASEDSQ